MEQTKLIKRVTGVLMILMGLSLNSSAELIKFKSGKVLSAKIIHQTEEYIQVDMNIGIPITHYLDDIESIEVVYNAELDKNFLDAAYRFDLKMMKEYLEEGANINVANTLGETALMFIAEYGSNDLLEFLLSEGADAGIQNNRNETVFDFALKADKVEVIKILLDYSQYMDDPQRMWGEIPLIKAVKYGNKEMIDLLVNYGFDVNERDAWGNTPFHYAEEIPEEDQAIPIMRILKSAGATK